MLVSTNINPSKNSSTKTVKNKLILAAFVILSMGIFSCSKKNSFEVNKPLIVNESIISDDKKFKLTLQGDGNLVLSNEKNEPVWASNTAGKPATKVIFQGDGNLVLSDDAGSPHWSSGTYMYMGSKMVLGDNGVLALLHEDKPVWANGVSLVPQQQPQAPAQQPSATDSTNTTAK